MKYRKFLAGFAISLAACSEPDLDETLICWTEYNSIDLSVGKYSSEPETICVPIAAASSLPASTLERAVIRNDRNDRGSQPPSNQPPSGGATTQAQDRVELSEIHESGPVAAIRKSDD